MNTNRILTAAGIAMAAVFAAGLLRIFLLRFEAGDVYPPYSTLRADPLGARVLYESLAACRGVTVERNYRAPHRIGLTPDTALLFLGDTISPFDRIPLDTAAYLNSFVGRGGRIAFTFMPAKGSAWTGKDEDEDEEDPNEESSGTNAPAASTNASSRVGAPHAAARTNAAEHVVSTNALPHGKAGDSPFPRRERRRRSDDWRRVELPVDEWLGLHVEYKPLADDRDAVCSTNAAWAGLPRALPCHTSLVFVEGARSNATTNVVAAALPPAVTNTPAWQVVYSRDGGAVVVERRVGRGSIALCAPGYFVSNEAMRKDRSPDLLLWLTGGRRRIVFDEYHHGLAREGNVATLARQYRLHGLAAGLALLAALFIWQSLSSLVPRSARGASDGGWDVAEGKGSTPGLVNLLRRSVPARGVLRACFEEWRKAHGGRGGADAGKADAMQAVLEAEERQPPHKRNPVRAYNEMAAIWKREH